MKLITKQLILILAFSFFLPILAYSQTDKEIKCGIFNIDISDEKEKIVIKEIRQYLRGEIDEPKTFYAEYGNQYDYFDCLSNPKPKTISYEFLEQIRKDARKSSLKQLGLAENTSEAKTISAQVFLIFNEKEEALDFANEAINLDNRNFEAYFVKSLAKMRFISESGANLSEGLQAVETAISLNSDFAPAYAVKAEILLNQAIGNFKPEHIGKYEAVIESIDKYLKIASNSPKADFWNGQKSAVEYLLDSMEKRKESKSTKSEMSPVSNAEKTEKRSLRILSKPQPRYTEPARKSSFQGSVLLRLWFGEDGKISNVLIVKSLPFGLTEQAVDAAKQIKFEPEIKNGEPHSATKLVQYSFTVY